MLTLAGFQTVKLFAVEDTREGLLRALEAAERYAVELTRAKPRQKRVTAKPAVDWTLTGAPTYEAMTEDATSVAIVRDDELTELEYWVPTGDEGFVRTTLQKALGAKTPLAKVAGAVRAMFARADREKPRPETVKDLERQAKRTKTR